MIDKICDNTSVGMIVKKEGKILLIERKKFPYGFAPPAGHLDGDTYETAARRELKEEVGLNSRRICLLTEGRKDNPCRRQGGSWHYWKIFEVKAAGKIKRNNKETKQAGWYSGKEIQNLAARTRKYLGGEISEREWQQSPGLESVWYEWMSEMKII